MRVVRLVGPSIVVAVIVGGLMLPLVAEYAYPRGVQSYYETTPPNWVAFYHRFEFGVFPLVTVCLTAATILVSRPRLRRLSILAARIIGNKRWELLIAAAITGGIILPLVAEYAFPATHTVPQFGFSLVLPGWVLFYRGFIFGFLPIGTVGIGAFAILISRPRFRSVRISIVRPLTQEPLRTIALLALMIIMGMVGGALWPTVRGWVDGTWLDDLYVTEAESRQASPSFRDLLR